ncbi:MAG: Beta-lactamase hydrolase-like protein [Alphaproteobacteria bacterium]|nr:MAG: Beta-lactamase hydrolase-like protein [Alphaproteobacteria bacterium]
MQPTFLTDDFAVYGQMDADDMHTALAAGFKTIICNRPDSEDGAVPFDSLKPIAEAQNVPIIYQPVVSGALSDDDARQLAEILDSAEKPVLAYCRSGARCTALFDMAQAYLAV